MYNKLLCRLTLIEERCMKKPISRNKKRIRLLRKSYIIYAALIAAGLLLIAFAITDLITGELEYAAARNEYESLREFSPVMSIIGGGLYQSKRGTSPPDAAEAEPAQEAGFAQEAESAQEGFTLTQGAVTSVPVSKEVQESPPPKIPLSELPESEQAGLLAELKGINPDFVGWIYIRGVVDYPVVRGSDNECYLDTTFYGNNNPSGAIFMDFRNLNGFDDSVCAIFGHNMRNGTMFQRLHKYSDRAFLETHPYVVVVTEKGEVLYYRVFAARYEHSRDLLNELCLSDKSADPAEFIGAPDGASQFLVLSTCTNSLDKDERFHVYAALEG